MVVEVCRRVAERPQPGAGQGRGLQEAKARAGLLLGPQPGVQLCLRANSSLCTAGHMGRPPGAAWGAGRLAAAAALHRLLTVEKSQPKEEALERSSSLGWNSLRPWL